MRTHHSFSPPESKRLKLEPSSPTAASRTPETYDDNLLNNEETVNDGTENEHQCSICLQDILDRTIIPTCSHEFCFECLLVWSGVLHALFSLLEMTYFAIDTQNNQDDARYAPKPSDSMLFIPSDLDTTSENTI